MATVSELKQIATDLELTFKSKVTKPELEAMIDAERQRRADRANEAFVTANSTPLPKVVAQRLGLMPLTAPRNVPLTTNARELNYRSPRQGGNALTAKQVKRLRKKDNKNS